MINLCIIEREPSFQKTYTAFFNSLGGCTIFAIYTSAEKLLSGFEKPKHLDIIIFSVYNKEDPEQLTLLKKMFTKVKIITTMAFAENSLVLSLLKNHADGILLKNDGLYAVHSAIMCSLNHGLFISPVLFKNLADHMIFHIATPGLIAFNIKEKQIIGLLGEGLSYKQIAGKTGVTSYTVNHHLKKIYKKAGVNSRSQLLALMQRFTPGNQQKD